MYINKTPVPNCLTPLMPRKVYCVLFYNLAVCVCSNVALESAKYELVKNDDRVDKDQWHYDSISLWNIVRVHSICIRLRGYRVSTYSS